MNRNTPYEASPSMIRWIMHVKGKKIVENHDHGRTWRKVYKDNKDNIDAICFQLLPDNKLFYIPPSPEGLYWQSDIFESVNGSPTVIVARQLCSKKETKLNKATGQFEALWHVITVDKNKKVTKSVKTSQEIGYDSRLLMT